MKIEVTSIFIFQHQDNQDCLGLSCKENFGRELDSPLLKVQNSCISSTSHTVKYTVTGAQEAIQIWVGKTVNRKYSTDDNDTDYFQKLVGVVTFLTKIQKWN